MSVAWTGLVVPICVLACMQTVLAARLKSDIADQTPSGESGEKDNDCIPVSTRLGSQAIAASDIILEGGSSYSSKLVKGVSGWDMSHVMIAAESKTESMSRANQLAGVHVWIVEALEEGVKGRWLWNSLYDADFFRVHRMHCGPELADATGSNRLGACHADWSKAVSFLDFHTGSAYGFGRLVGAGLESISKAVTNLGANIWGTSDEPCPPEEDKQEQLEDYMCSELVWGALRHGDFLPDDIRAFKGMSPEQLERCALGGKRNGYLPEWDAIGSVFIEKSHIPWHKEMQWSVSEAQPCLDKEMIINFLEALKMDRRMTLSRWLTAAQSEEHLGQGLQAGDEIKATHARGLFKDKRGSKLMDGLLDAFIILELTETFNQQCEAGKYVFLHGVDFAAPKLEIMSRPFCSVA